MASPPLPVALPALDNTFGSLYIGVVIAAGLWGISTAQAYWYYSNYPRDKLSLKCFVAFVWIVDTVQQALIAHLVYIYLIKNYFNPLFLDTQLWSLDLQSLFEVLTCVAVQGFFLMRIWRLSNGMWWILVIPTLLVLLKFAFGIVYVVSGFQSKSISAGQKKTRWESETINALAAAADVAIAAFMTWLLYRSRTGFARTDNLVDRLMVYTLNTGAITSLCAVVTLITALCFPKVFLYGAFYFMTGRLYINTMLASLNARAKLSANMGGEVHSLSQVKFSSRKMNASASDPASTTVLGSHENMSKQESTHSINFAPV